jgi:hypothetical protein
VDIKLVHDGSLVVSFIKRKSDPYRHGTSVDIASSAHGTIFPVLMLRYLLDRVP